MRFENAFPRALDAVGDVLDSVDRFALRAGISERRSRDVRLVSEELFVNMLRHDRGGSDSIQFLLEVTPGRLTIRLRDFDVDGPDMKEIDRALADAARVEMTPGGLGVRIARSIADGLTYEYDEGTLTVTATLNLAAAPTRT